MQKQIMKIDLSVSNIYNIPEGWEIDKFLDVQGNYIILVLNKMPAQEELNNYIIHYPGYPSGSVVTDYTSGSGTLR